MNLLTGDNFINQKGEECLLVYANKELVRLQVLSSPSYLQVYPRDEFVSLIDRLLIIKLKRKPLTRENLPRHLGEFQLALAGKRPIDMIIEGKQFDDYEIKKEEYEIFRVYAIAMMKKVHKCNRKIAEENFYFFYHRFGLRIK